MRNTKTEREASITVAVLVTKPGPAVVPDTLVKADFPQPHAHQARGGERGAVQVPPSPLHEAHGHGGEDPPHGGNSKGCHLGVGAIDEKHGGRARGELQKNTEHRERGPWDSEPPLCSRQRTRDVHALRVGAHSEHTLGRAIWRYSSKALKRTDFQTRSSISGPSSKELIKTGHKYLVIKWSSRHCW